MADQGGDNVVIRTMQDDLTGSRSKPSSPAPPNNLPTPTNLTTPIPPPPNPVTSAASSMGQFPLPPKGKTVIPAAPNVARRNRRRILVWGSAVLALVLVIGGGVWAFVTFVSAPAGSSESLTPEIPFSGSVPIPGSTSLAIHYNLMSPDVRSQLLQLWQNSSKTLLQGNPKDFLQNPNINEFMYVMLSGEARPYLLVPKTGVSEQLIPQLSENQVTTFNELYVLHSLNAASYLEALRQTVTPDPLADQLDDATNGQPLNLYVGEGTLNQIRTSLAGEPFGAGSVKSAILSASLSSDKKAFLFAGTGATNLTSSLAPSSSPLTGLVQPSAADQSLLSAIPGDAGFVRLGGNLTQDIEDWQTVSTVLNRAVLDQAAVNTLVKQLTGSYAFYRRLGADGVEDIGLITKIPAETTPALVLGDAALEQALQAIIPLILPAKPVTLPAFTDGAYQNIPLRFANLLGGTKALDYIIQGTQLSLATSKEGMFSALDIAAKKQPAFAATSPWQALLASSGPIPLTPQVFFGYLNVPSLLELLPSSETKLPAVVTQEKSESGLHITGVLLLSASSIPLNNLNSPLPSTSPSPSPSPL